MNKSITLLFAYRDRDPSRVFHSMKCLEKQTDSHFQVIFVDYGSSEKNSRAIMKTLSDFSFVEYHYVAHPGLLWNKSKAFNYGIRKAIADYIVTVDIDLIFYPEFVASAKRLAKPDNYTVFSYAYLQKQEVTFDISDRDFSDLKPSHIGYITGSGLYSKASLQRIHGFDEFYHFYGSEDEDLFIRLENAGIHKKEEERNMLAHQWHPRYPFEERNELSLTPKINNIRRINLKHYQVARDRKKILPDNQEEWGACYTLDDREKLQTPDEVFMLDCKESSVIHFLYEFLPNSKGVVEVNFSESEKGFNLKRSVKKALGKESEPLWDLKQVNDEILKLILFQYRNHNYEYWVGEDLRSLTFRIDMGK
jgi:glycosyltransferase involved in cell wall biosynthesis